MPRCAGSSNRHEVILGEEAWLDDRIATPESPKQPSTSQCWRVISDGWRRVASHEQADNVLERLPGATVKRLRAESCTDRRRTYRALKSFSARPRVPHRSCRRSPRSRPPAPSVVPLRPLLGARGRERDSSSSVARNHDTPRLSGCPGHDKFLADDVRLLLGISSVRSVCLFGLFAHKEYVRTLCGQKNFTLGRRVYEKVPRPHQHLLAPLRRQSHSGHSCNTPAMLGMVLGAVRAWPDARGKSERVQLLS